MIRINFPEVQFPIQGMDEVVLPKMVRIRQFYDNTKIEDIPAYLREALNAGDFKDQVNIHVHASK